MRTLLGMLLALVIATPVLGHASDGSPTVVLGSKKFTESFVLAEVAKQSLEETGFHVVHRQGMGGTIVLWEALRQGSIAAYPDYTGTIQEEILKGRIRPSVTALREQLAGSGDFRPGTAVATAHAAIRARIPYLDRDRALDGEVAAAVTMVADGSILAAVRAG